MSLYKRIMQPYLSPLNPLRIKMLCRYQLLTRVPKIFDLCLVTLHFQLKSLMLAQQRLGTGLVSTIVLARYPGKLLSDPGFYLSYLGEELGIKTGKNSYRFIQFDEHILENCHKILRINIQKQINISFVSHSLYNKVMRSY